MENQTTNSLLEAVDVRHLYYFSVVAEESSFRKAAERLFMAQPPLSRQIKQLEERLGVALFVRHSKGLILTPEGVRVLEIIRPLLLAKDAAYARLHTEIHQGGKTLRIGFSTAFEQGIFTQPEAVLRARYGSRLHVARAASPRLASAIRKGRLDAAFAALPLDAPGLSIHVLPHAEPLVAAVPAIWGDSDTMDRRNEGSGNRLFLKDVSGRKLFWFKREENPAFFDFAKACFTQAGFTPHYIAEPAEHDVLLARIATGEGMALLAASFAAIRREGVTFASLAETGLRLELGIITLPSATALAEELAKALAGNVTPPA